MKSDSEGVVNGEVFFQGLHPVSLGMTGIERFGEVGEVFF